MEMEMAASEVQEKQKENFQAQESASRFAKGDIVVVRRRMEAGWNRPEYDGRIVRIVEVDGGAYVYSVKKIVGGGVEKNVEEGDLKKKNESDARRAPKPRALYDAQSGKAFLPSLDFHVIASRMPTRARHRSQHACMSSLNWK